jgi:arylsulfatase A-like enzyme
MYGLSRGLRVVAKTSLLTSSLVVCTPVPPTDSPPPSADTGARPPRAPNILFVIADDLGADVAPCMAPTADRLPMPGIEALCAKGVRFSTAWSNPTCSPTRATLLTGRYSFRTGVGQQILGNRTDALRLDETTLPQLLKSDTGPAYASAAFGKWHLSNNTNGGSAHPHSCGFDAYAGLLVGAHEDYYSWRRTENDSTQTVEQYSTTRIADDAINWLDQQTGPWFLWLAFTAPHTPLHIPPGDLHSQPGLVDTEADIRRNPVPYYAAAAEALDHEISRVLRATGDEGLENTWVIFVGDNGTPGRVIPAPRTRTVAKGTLYEGGIHVPLVIAGPAIDEGGRTVDAPVNLVDVFRTVAALAGRTGAIVDDGRPIDSVSLLPYLHSSTADAQRDWIYSELFGPEIDTASAGQTARTGRYKLIRFNDGESAFFDLLEDPMETHNMIDAALAPEAQVALGELGAAIDTLNGDP